MSTEVTMISPTPSSTALRAHFTASSPVFSRPLSVSASHRSEEHTSELQSHHDLVCRLLLEKKKQDHLAHVPSRAYHRLPHRAASSLVRDSPSSRDCARENDVVRRIASWSTHDIRVVVCVLA